MLTIASYDYFQVVVCVGLNELPAVCQPAVTVIRKFGYIKK